MERDSYSSCVKIHCQETDSENRFRILVEYRLVPYSTETGEFELENWIVIPRGSKKKLQENFIVI
jgi:hypothetical protein